MSSAVAKITVGLALVATTVSAAPLTRVARGVQNQVEHPLSGAIEASSCNSVWGENYFGINKELYLANKDQFKVGEVISAGGEQYYIDAMQIHGNCNSDVALVYVANKPECVDGTPWERTAECDFGGKIVTPLRAGVDSWALPLARARLRFSSYGKCNTKAQVLAFPITMETVDAIGKDRGSKAVSLRVFGHGQLAGLSWDALAERVGPNHNRPTHPDSTNPSDRAHFWAEFTRVAALQKYRREGGMAEDHLAVPTMFKGYTMDEAALAVEKDFPSKFPTQLVEQFLSPTGPLGQVEFDSDVVPHIGNDDFVNKQVMLARIIGWAVSTVSPKAFGAKWRHGRARPEEIAHAINAGDSRVQMAPRATRDLVKKLRLERRHRGVDFTAYGNGAPNHPSWPAMHSAASSASVYLATVLKLTPAQLLEAQKLDCAVASFRSFAGVHYESDNMAGLVIGQEVLRAELPEFLVKNYGSDKGAVVDKLQNVIAAHDWRTTGSCFHTPRFY